jgi:hypothetical protein
VCPSVSTATPFCEPADEQDPAALPRRPDHPHGGHVGARGADQRGARIGAELEEALTHLLVRRRDGGRAAQGEPFEAGGEPPRQGVDIPPVGGQDNRLPGAASAATRP